MQNRTVTSKAINLERFFVNKASFIRNESNDPTKEKIQIAPNFYRKISKNADDVFTVIMGITIERDNEGEPLPFTVYAEIGGIFKLFGVTPEEQNTALQANVSAILFPYLRSTVSTVMALSGVKPIVLPVINVDKLFSEESAQVNQLS